jgi:uncharacterized protein (DUF697 family)/ribosome biogenesis GTPase A
LAVLCSLLLLATALSAQEDTEDIWRFATQKQKIFCEKFEHLCTESKQKLNEIIKKGVKIAITGNSGVGKSSLVNALTNCAHDSETCDYARSCGSDQCTNKEERFRHPTVPNLDYFDIPGVGTADFSWEKPDSKFDNSTYYNKMFVKHPVVNYFQYMEIGSYDAIILVSAERPTNSERNLYNEIKKKQASKVVFIVRNKVNIAFERAKYDRMSHKDVLYNARKVLKDSYNHKNELTYLIDAHNSSEEFRPYNELNLLKADIVSSLGSIATAEYDKELSLIQSKNAEDTDNFVYTLIYSCSALSFVAAAAFAQLPFAGRLAITQIQVAMLISIALKLGAVLTPNAALVGIAQAITTIGTPALFDATFAEYFGTMPIIGNLFKGASAATITVLLGNAAYLIMKEPVKLAAWEAEARNNPKDDSEGNVVITRISDLIASIRGDKTESQTVARGQASDTVVSIIEEDQTGGEMVSREEELTDRQVSINFSDEAVSLSLYLTKLANGKATIDSVMQYFFGREKYSINPVIYYRYYSGFLKWSGRQKDEDIQVL